MLFPFLREAATKTVQFAGEAAKFTVGVGMGVTAALTQEVLGQDHAAAKTVTEVARGVTQGVAFIVDKAAVPLGTVLARGAVKGAERFYDLGAGVAEAVLTEHKEQGWARAARAATGIAAVAVVGAGIGIVADGLVDAIDGLDLDVEASQDAVADASGAADRATPELHHVEPHWVDGHYRGDTWVEGYWRDGDGDTSVHTGDGYWRGTPKA